jgi:uncharacterized membrane protein
MAGIGFELRKILSRRGYTHLLEAYIYAGVISSGPWLISIVGIALIGMLSLNLVVPKVFLQQFQVSVTYLFVFSLIFSGVFQFSYVRYIADRLFERRTDLVLPTFMATLLVLTLISLVVAAVVFFGFFAEMSLVYRVVMTSSFVLLCNIWIAVIFLTGMKKHREIAGLFLLSYVILTILAIALSDYGADGLLIGFWFGQVLLFTGVLRLILICYPSHDVFSTDFFRRLREYRTLVGVGIFFNLGIWVDKIMFWYYPPTSDPLVGLFRFSPIYDFPIAVAYLSIFPGMAAFLLRIETDFVEYYQQFYDAVREGGTLDHIQEMRNEMVWSIQQGVLEIIKIQLLAMLCFFAAGGYVLDQMGIPRLHHPLLYIDLVSVALHVVMVSLLSIFFYLDAQRTVLKLSLMLLVLNALLTAISMHLGPFYYGYGFALALLVVSTVGMMDLNKRLDRLEYITFMLR